MGNHRLPNPIEHRLRLSGSFEDTNNKRRFLRTKSSKEADEMPPQTYTQVKISKCKISTVKLVLLVITGGTFLTLLRSPAVSDSKPAADARYTSDLDINWVDISETLAKLTEGQDKIGLLNFNESEIGRWREEVPTAKHVVLHLDFAGEDVTWESLYPEWIDEEEESEVPVCPSLSRPKSYRNYNIDLVAVKLPCRKSGQNWSRDVARLHLQLAAARIAASAKNDFPVPVLFVTDCFPLPNLFTCKELVVREGNAWLYNPKIDTLHQKLQLPVGSCELSLPKRVRVYSGTAHREAYAMILHSADIYVCGAIAAAQSIRSAGSTRDLVMLVDDTISEYHRSGLAAAGWKIRTIERIRNPKAGENAYNEWNYSKFRLWQLTDYDKIIFIDADLLILRNIDFLFGMPEITATGNDATLFNSGVMVIEPSNCTFQLLMDHINEIESYNGGDQGYLNEIFTWWHRIPRHMNFLKHFWEGDEEEKKLMKTALFGADPPVLYVLHYLGRKPWICFRDYDCNWNSDISQEFASDAAHKTWWKVHDAMPEKLQKFCLLSSHQKAGLEWHRREAEKGNYTDRHWNITITDERLNTCYEDFCLWESMLLHWGETNWTDDKSSTTAPAMITQTSLPSL
ncbi:hypothetical protein MKW98_000690 [Papaver atlanticum]|uniref:Hexosyltransferase n=1 Tax=Papaver atlanticum TaxID=357466 RepID=A0AAD4T4R5_9MAGN|nr:hypothetical protein MKW98_000690 [Papaver atlanticum]